MSTPERALDDARAAAERMREAGAYPAEADAEPAVPAGASMAKLAEWAMIDPDPTEVRSTRRWGAPITAAKRGLLRLLAQYHIELLAQQTRFNIGILGELRKLEQRVAELERRLPDQ